MTITLFLFMAAALALLGTVVYVLKTPAGSLRAAGTALPLLLAIVGLVAAIFYLIDAGALH